MLVDCGPYSDSRRSSAKSVVHPPACSESLPGRVRGGDWETHTKKASYAGMCWIVDYKLLF